MLSHEILSNITMVIKPDLTVSDMVKPQKSSPPMSQKPKVIKRQSGQKPENIKECIQAGMFRNSKLYLSMNTKFVLRIEDIVCKIFGCSPRELYGFDPSSKSADPRKMCFMLCKDEAGLSYQQIADRYGKRSKPGVFMAVKTARNLIQFDRQFKQLYFVAISQIYSGKVTRKTRSIKQLSFSYENEMP